MSNRINPSPTWLKLLRTIAPLSAIVGASLIILESDQAAIAQSSANPTNPPAFTVPSELPSGAILKVDGSSHMMAINEALKQQFQAKFPGSTIALTANGTQAALQSLLKGEIDLVAIGRPLTAAELAQGLKEITIRREKIAIIVGTDNPYQSSLTSEQLAQIFQGEITDWAELGGPVSPIRVVDRPESSDTRQALSRYPVFQASPFEPGQSATQVAEDDTEAVIKALGKDGIGYAIASQVLGRNDVQILPLYGTTPDSEEYALSQPLGYVYKDNPNLQTQAFLGYVTSTSGQEVVISTQKMASQPVANPSETAAGDTAKSDASTDSNTAVSAASGTAESAPFPKSERFPWWWLLLPIFGLVALLIWASRRRVTPPPIGTDAPVAGKIVLTPRNCRDAYAYWEIPEEVKAEFEAQGGRSLALRLYEVTNMDLAGQTPHNVKQNSVKQNSVKQIECGIQDVDRHLPIALDDRDYVVELGYVTDDGQWLKVARSEPVRVPACSNAEKIQAAATAAAIASSPHLASPTTWKQESELDKLGQTVSAQFDTAKETVTNLPGDATQVAESVIAGGGAAIAGVRATAKSLIDHNPQRSEHTTPSTVSPTPAFAKDCRIILVPRNAQEAYAYWEVADAYKATAQEQGGTTLQLRIHDVTNLDINHDSLHRTQIYPCQETDQDMRVTIPVSDRDYIAELGYTTSSDQWISIIRSHHIHIPSDSNSTAKI